MENDLILWYLSYLVYIEPVRSRFSVLSSVLKVVEVTDGIREVAMPFVIAYMSPS